MKSLNQNLTTKQILCILQGTGAETKGEIGKLVQLDKALQKARSGTAINCTPTPSSGDVQVLLSWNNYNDLDLVVTDPNGEPISFKNRRASSGGQLEIDMNVEYPDSKSPIENIYWPTNGAPIGTYNVYLLYFNQHDESVETPFKIGVKKGTKMDNYTGKVTREKEMIHICSFSVGNDRMNIENPDAPVTYEQDLIRLKKERERLQKELERVTNELKRFGNNR